MLTIQRKKVGYFFGSFFIITTKSHMKKLELHEKVKQEIIEDGALGKNNKRIRIRIK